MKKRIIYIFILILIVLFCFITYKIINKNYIERIYNSLVYIECVDDNSINSGSGFVYKIEDNKDYILTNYHVIAGYFDIYLYNINKKKVKAKLVNYDDNNDIAILVIDDVLDLKVANIDKYSKVRPRDKVFTASFPLGIDNSGINSGSVIELRNIGHNFKVIETSANIDFGSSGGALLNSNGKVIGMISLKDNNNSFSIPIDFVMNIVEKLENKRLNNINLGAVFTNITNIELLQENDIEIVDINGVVIVKLDENGLLFKNSLKKGDIITKFNDVDINNVNDLKEEISNHKKGDVVSIEYYRSNKYNCIDIEL